MSDGVRLLASTALFRGFSAKELEHISERTVESHLANAYIKLGVSSKFDLVRRAAR